MQGWKTKLMLLGALMLPAAAWAATHSAGGCCPLCP